MECARVLLAHKSPLPFDPELLFKLSPLIFKLAAQQLTRDIIGQDTMCPGLPPPGPRGLPFLR
jgi:hypothetical protein